MPTLKKIVLSLATTAAVTGGLLSTADQGEASQSEWQTRKRTLAYLHAVERTDLTTIDEFLHPDIVLTQPMTYDGDQEPDVVGTGRDEVLDYFRSVFARTPYVDFTDIRVSVTNGGTVSFVETDGDFATADDHPYRNVYVMRFEWTSDGRLMRITDYYNPIIVCMSFPELPACDFFAPAG